LEEVKIYNFAQLLQRRIEQDGRDEDCGLMLRYDWDVLMDNLFVILQIGLLDYHQPFNNPTLLELDCKVECTITNQVIMLETHSIWVQYMNSEENDLHNNFQG